MATKPFDVTPKDSLELGAAGWPTLLGGWPARRVRLVDADLATVTAAADKVLPVSDAHDGLLHVELTSELLQGVRPMEDSTTYQYILEQGGLRTARTILKRPGERHIGSPDSSASNRIDAIDDVERIESSLKRIHSASSWDDLLGPS